MLTKKYELKQFDLPEQIPGLSQKQIEVHLGLYKGYVTHVNHIYEQLALLQENNADPYVIAELKRRFAFEFNGMRMHEYYFNQLEHGPSNMPAELESFLSEYFGSTEAFLSEIKAVATSRGIGWTTLYWDSQQNKPIIAWTTDHELGTLAGLNIIYTIDMWEHAYMVDYLPATKTEYIEAFLNATNWETVAKRLPQH